MYVDHDAFAVWLAANRRPDLGGRTYEHAMFVRWCEAGMPGARPDPDAGPLVAYTDGSGTMAHLPCGAGVVVYRGDVVVLEASRPLGLGTNNHAELSAARIALAITDDWRHEPLTIRTDSMYVLGVLTAPKGPRPDQVNGKLIHLTRLAMEGREVTFEHVKGHAKIAGNERADHLAGLARKRQQVVVTARAA